ncbi:MAG: right-handed parallel beta-helix repeat-containing protein, partial [Ignavibacteriaceae bacterium]|nr:right-handed parallel beta-helix repeat-containing protein [Ignavibacteriaceae bacterium]
MKHIFFLIVLPLLFMGNLRATNFYVDSEGGHDADSGKSVTSAWKSISKVNSYGEYPGFNDGDIISFKCGGRWIGETLIPTTNNLLFNSYGIGDSPVIDRNGDNPAYWRAEDTGDSLSAFDTTGTGGFCVVLDSVNNITFNGIKFIRGFNTNILIWNCNHITFESCNIESAWQSFYTNAAPGMMYIGGESNYPSHHITVKNSTISFSRFGHGVYWDGAREGLFDHDTVNFNGANGIQIYTGNPDSTSPNMADSFVVRYCVIKQNATCGNGETGLFINGATNSLFYYNVIENNNTSAYSGCIQIENNYGVSAGKHGNAPNNNGFYNNTLICHGPGHVAIYLGGDGAWTGIDSLYFKNNIIYLNNISEFALDFSVSMGTATQFANNDYYIPSGKGNNFFDYIGDTCQTLETWKTKHGYDIIGSLQGDPSFKNYDSIYSLQNNSPAVLRGVWLNLNPAQDISGRPIGNPPDIGAYQNATYLSGTISTNTTLNGNYAITGDLSIVDGTLIISPETRLYFENGASMFGYIQASRATFNFIPDTAGNVGNIVLGGSGISNDTINNCGTIQLYGEEDTLQNCIINNPVNGIYIYYASPNIINNTIIDPGHNGIYCWGVSSNPIISGNHIYRSDTLKQGNGLYFMQSAGPFVTNNDISGFNCGLYSGGGGLCFFGTPNTDAPNPNNRFSNNHIGLSANCSIIISAGDKNYDINSFYPGNFNTIIASGNDTAVILHDQSVIYATNNFWGADASFDNPPIGNYYYDYQCGCGSDNTGSLFLWVPYLTSDPWQPTTDGNSNAATITKPSNKDHTSKSLADNESNNNISKPKLNKAPVDIEAKDNIISAISLEKSGRIDDANKLYENLISKGKNVRTALTSLIHQKSKSFKEDISGHLRSLLTKNPENSAAINNVLGSFSLSNNKFDDAMALYNNVIKSDPVGYDGINARFEKLFAYLNIKKDKAKTKELLVEIKSMNLTDYESKTNISLVEDLLG